MKIWTYYATPFRMGAVQTAMWSDVGEPVREFSLAGYDFGVFQNPNTKYFHVAERSSGALCGFSEVSAEHAQELVTSDLRDTKFEMIEEQIAEITKAGRIDGEHERLIPAETFWSRFNA
jgi:hypothetical protein